MPRRAESRHGGNPESLRKISSAPRPLSKAKRIPRSRGHTNAGVSNGKFPPGLYIVSTPIGHADDITLRALKVLDKAEIIACEDTRHTGTLMARYGITTRRISYHEHNATRVRPGILKKIQTGGAVALVSDAGTPLISDPGYKLVNEAIKAGISIIPIPGASAPIAALVSSGLPTDKFVYCGFLPSRAIAREKVLLELSLVPCSLIFLESPQRLVSTLEALGYTLGNRKAVVARELTKLHETILRGSVHELTNHYSNEQASGIQLRGELTIVIGPPPKRETKDLGENTNPDTDKLLQGALKEMSTRDAVKRVAKLTGSNRRDIYDRAIKLLKEVK